VYLSVYFHGGATTNYTNCEHTQAWLNVACPSLLFFLHTKPKVVNQRRTRRVSWRRRLKWVGCNSEINCGTALFCQPSKSTNGRRRPLRNSATQNASERAAAHLTLFMRCLYQECTTYTHKHMRESRHTVNKFCISRDTLDWGNRKIMLPLATSHIQLWEIRKLLVCARFCHFVWLTLCSIGLLFCNCVETRGFT
jgi:hypothetical protein